MVSQLKFLTKIVMYKGFSVVHIPKDQWGHEFIYSSNGPSDFELKSLGSDAREGGIGEAKDISSKEIIH
jgi:hypothetical protein